jgi:hypothetical protein
MATSQTLQVSEQRFIEAVDQSMRARFSWNLWIDQMIEEGQSPEDFENDKKRWLHLIRTRYIIPELPEDPYSEAGKAIIKVRRAKMGASLTTFVRCKERLQNVRK